MNRTQFKLVKTFLDGFKIPPKKLAKAWKIDIHLVRKAAAAANYDDFETMPDEDVMIRFNKIFNT